MRMHLGGGAYPLRIVAWTLLGNWSAPIRRSHFCCQQEFKGVFDFADVFHCSEDSERQGLAAAIGIPANGAMTARLAPRLHD